MPTIPFFDTYYPSRNPADAEAVKLGAKRIRDLQDVLQELLQQLFNDDRTLKEQTIDTDQIVDEAVTLPKLADQARGSLITFDADDHAALLAPGAAGKFLKSDGVDLVFDDTPVVGVLSAQVLGPLTDTAWNEHTQTVTITLTETRDVLVYAFANFVTYDNSNATLSLSVDGVVNDSKFFSVGSGQPAIYGSATLVYRGSLAAGDHILLVTYNNYLADPGGNAGGPQFVPQPPGAYRPVKFMVHLL